MTTVLAKKIARNYLRDCRHGSRVSGEQKTGEDYFVLPGGNPAAFGLSMVSSTDYVRNPLKAIIRPG